MVWQQLRKWWKSLLPDLDFEVSGYVGLPELTRANRNYITILINGRYIKNFLLNRAILDGYGSKAMVGRFPLAVINIQIDPIWPMSMSIRPSKRCEFLKSGNSWP